MMFEDWAHNALAPARHPVGRFHYDGQNALYLSATPKGCVMATRRYMDITDPPRVLVPLAVYSDKIIDLRNAKATGAYQIDVSQRAVEWQNFHAQGKRSPTWDMSDRIRELGLHGMLYASRTDPRKTHLTLFAWNDSTGAAVTSGGPTIPWES